MVSDLFPTRPTSIFETRPGATGTPGNFSGLFDGDNPFCFVSEPEKSNKNEQVAIYGINADFLRARLCRETASKACATAETQVGGGAGIHRS
jgi:hypothetical protein